jgi:hypothetical protein
MVTKTNTFQLKSIQAVISLIQNINFCQKDVLIEIFVFSPGHHVTL